jgi:hypothetical protein
MHILDNRLALAGMTIVGFAGAGAVIGTIKSDETGQPVSKTLVNMGMVAGIGSIVAGGSIGMHATTKAQLIGGHLAFYGGAVATAGLAATVLLTN